MNKRVEQKISTPREAYELRLKRYYSSLLSRQKAERSRRSQPAKSAVQQTAANLEAFFADLLASSHEQLPKGQLGAGSSSSSNRPVPRRPGLKVA